MKKLVYSLAVVLLGMVSCTSFDDPTTENYGAGPDISVNITPGEQTDSAFTVTIIPDEDAAYYAYAIEASPTPSKIDSSTLYKGGYGNTVVKRSNTPITTITIDDADPNTTYQVYAVAGSERGIIGKLAVKSITTTDKFSPRPTAMAQSGDDKAVRLTFSESIAPASGAVVAQYYKEWDIMNPVTIPAEEVEVEVSGKNVIFAAPTAPAGSYLCFSYEAGAFKDKYGNACAALNSGLNLTTGSFAGAWVHVTNESFEITDEMITAPADGSLIAKVEDFKGEFTFPFNIYRNDQYVEDGDLTVTYTGGNRAVTYNLAASDWTVADNKLTFVLPASPAGGDVITVSLVEGAVTDVYGNPNEAFTSETSWLFFAPTIDMVVRSFQVNYISYWSEDNTVESMGTISIEQDPEEANGLLIKGLFIENSVLKATVDLPNAKIIIPDWQVLGQYTNSKGTTYGMMFAVNGADELILTINPDGTLTPNVMWGLYALDENFEAEVDWFEVCKVSEFAPVQASVRKAAARVQTAKAVKAIKVAKSARSLKKHVRK